MKKRIIAAAITAALCVPLSASAWYGLGDMDYDGYIDAFDLAIMKREFYEEKDYWDYDSFPEEADLNENGAFTAYDISQMQNYLLGRIDSFSESPLVSSTRLASGEGCTDSGRITSTTFGAGQMGFAVDLFKQTAQNEENTLISPLSVSIALSMTANGADAQTRTEMESVLGSSVEDINEYMAYYLTNAAEQEDVRLNIANSVWFRDCDGLKVEEDFLNANSQYYGAEVFASSFDKGAVSDINHWVENETDGMIPQLVDNISPEDMMVLINAIAFDAEWEDIYEDYQIEDGTFTAADGTEQEAEMLLGWEDVYYEFDNAVGFSKAYKGYDYRFVAILPDEDITVSEWIAEMDSDAVLAELGDPSREYEVVTQTPKFKYETDLKLGDVLADMGMPTAFDPTNADFSNMAQYTEGDAEYPLYIGDVIHKTCIDLNETGTRAAAATAVRLPASAAPGEIIYKYVTLDRPFVYMIVDNNNIPLFMGTVQSVE